MVLAECVLLCTVSLADEGLVRLLPGLGSLLGCEAACRVTWSWPCMAALGETATTGRAASMLCALGELLEAPPFRSMEDWPGQKLGEQARRGASRGFDRNGMRFNIDGPILLLCLRDQSAERPCMDSTLITPNGWRKAATASKDRQTDTPLPASGLIASDILRSCTEGRRQIWSGGDGVVELLVLTSASLGLSPSRACKCPLHRRVPRLLWRCTHGPKSPNPPPETSHKCVQISVVETPVWLLSQHAAALCVVHFASLLH
jgi:hypothetical protein